MKTTVDIPDQTLKDAMRYLSTSVKRDAIVAALEEFNRRRRLLALADKLGTFDGMITRKELIKRRRQA